MFLKTLTEITTNVTIIQIKIWKKRKHPLALLQILAIQCFLLISRGESSKTADVHTFIAEPNKHVSQLRLGRSFRDRELWAVDQIPNMRQGRYQHEIADRGTGLNNM